MDVTHAFSSIDELGDGYGFRKIRPALGIEAFGINAIVMPPGTAGFWHYHDTQDELYIVHRGTAHVEVGEPSDPDVRILEAGGLAHVQSTLLRRISNPSASEDLVIIVVGGKDGYVERDGHLLNDEDLARRASFGSGATSGNA